MRARRLLAIAAIATMAAAACSAPSGPGVQLTIRKGSSFREAAESLSAHGLVSSVRVFSWYARIKERDRSLRWGTYVLRPGMSWNQMLDALQLGHGVIHQVTIPEGLSIADIEPLLIDALDVTKDSLDAAVSDTALLHELDIPTRTVEGYLFPDTYTFPDKTTARDAVHMMVEQFEREWRPEWTDKARSMRLNRNDIVTLASIVEREVRRDEERPVIAAVYLNRLKIGMPLMADPTVTYALGKKPGRVYLKDLKVKSPYNTYRRAGLPPGPIASPGLASIRAALYPARVGYRFFVAAPDGHHEFRRTYAQHLQAIEMVRAMKRDSTKP
ncbi:MAG TPA: endolytic transglycosylase MltG [Gemmatimonadaceae bacterium]